ncbi:MAG: branched-chain amino acid ABC transporter permease [Alphaproteobacteria bacterium]|nr:branched-chain amino acid ABC transporter permease [Alphaproteobacteria bacterium]
MTSVDQSLPRRTAWPKGWLVLSAGLLVLVLLYPTWTDPYSLTVLRDAMIFALFAVSLDYMWGKSGVLSFGHAAFFGIGAYAMPIIGPMVPTANAALVALLAGVAVAGIVAFVVGYFLIFGGVRGPYFTIVTLALCLVAQHIAIGWSEMTGGDAGLIGAPPFGIEMFGLSYLILDSVEQYYLVTAILTATLCVLWLACGGHYGRVLAAIQDNEVRARTLGYNTSGYLLVVFVISCMLAAVAGALYAVVSGYVAPDSVGLLLSTQVVVWVAVGGRGTLLGPVIGAFLAIRLQQVVSSIDFRLWPLVVGAFFVAMVFLFPDGVLPLVRRWMARAWGRLVPSSGAR